MIETHRIPGGDGAREGRKGARVEARGIAARRDGERVQPRGDRQRGRGRCRRRRRGGERRRAVQRAAVAGDRQAPRCGSIQQGSGSAVRSLPCWPIARELWPAHDMESVRRPHMVAIQRHLEMHFRCAGRHSDDTQNKCSCQDSGFRMPLQVPRAARLPPASASGRTRAPLLALPRGTALQATNTSRPR